MYHFFYCILYEIVLNILFATQNNNSCPFIFILTWELQPYMAVMETAIITAIYGSSIHTFFRGLKLQTLAVLWSHRQTADLGSFMAALQ